jgi:hypothetical protein
VGLRKGFQAEQFTWEQDAGYTFFPVLERLDQFDKSGMESEQMLSRTPFEEEDLVPPVTCRPEYTPQS